MKRYPKSVLYSGTLLIFIVVFVMGASIGQWQSIGFQEVWQLIANKLGWNPTPLDETHETLILMFRLPRVMVGILVGFSLGISGVLFQAVLRNPLADPFTLGVSSGAAFGATLAIFLDIAFTLFGFSSIPIFAFIGAILTLFLVYQLSQINGKTQVLTLIISGVIVSAFFSALIGLLKSLSDESLSTIIFWLMGRLDLSGNVYGNIGLLAFFAMVVTVLAFMKHRELDILSLGDEEAMQLGIEANRQRILLLSVASLATAAAVSFCGIIGFIGLIVPHVGRALLGPSHKALILFCGLLGSVLLVLADIFSRVVLEHGELPVGIITSLVGGPFFCWILLIRKKEMGGGRL